MWAVSTCFRARPDPDLWGHVRFGLDILARGHLTAVDPYSFTQDAQWIDHEWLSEVAFAIADRVAGVPGLVLLKAAILAGVFVLLARTTRGVDDRYRWWLLAAGMIGTAPGAFTIRPQLWTLLAIPLLWNALNHRRWLAGIPVLFALWANLHGGWIVGIGIAALWLIGRALDVRPRRLPIAETAAVATGLSATLLNPYLSGLWVFLLSTVRLSRNVVEWRPLWEQDDATAAIAWAVILGVIVVPTMLRRRSSMTWAGALPMVWLGVMSLFVSRLVPLFSEVAVLGLAVAWRSPSPSRADTSSAPRPVARMAVDAAALAVIGLFTFVPESRCLRSDAAWMPDVNAASAFNSASAHGRLVLPFNWGEYAIWHWGPRLRVSIDGRRETVYSQTTIDMQSAVAGGLPAGLDYLQRVRPEYVWLPRATSGPAAVWLENHGYRFDVDTGRSFIATRADLPPLTIAAPMSRCFP